MPGHRRSAGAAEGLRGLPAALCACALPAVATVLCMRFDAQVSEAAKALAYLLAVIAAAAWLPRWAGVLASLLGVTALNFFFVPPRRTFAVDGVEYWFTLAVLLAVSLLLNALVTSLRRRRAEAERREREAKELGALASVLASDHDPARLARGTVAWWRDSQPAPCALYLSSADASLRIADVEAGADDEGAARWAMEHRRPLGRGCADWPELALWCTPLHQPAPVGALLVPWTREPPPDAATLRHWQALAALLGQRLEQVRIAADADAARARAEAEAQRNAVLASLSHDLRTPLTVLLGNASLLREQDARLSPAQRAQLLAQLERETRDLVAMADDILQSARFSQPQWRLRTQWESPEELLGVALARMRRRWPGAAIHARVEPALPPVRVESGLMLQVLSNLVDNALRHGGEGVQVWIEVARGDDRLRIAVRDDGRGLPPDGSRRLFDAARGEASREGAGLGLLLCRTLVEAHGGRIVARDVRPGAEFVVELPLADAPPEAT